MGRLLQKLSGLIIVKQAKLGRHFSKILKAALPMASLQKKYFSNIGTPWKSLGERISLSVEQQEAVYQLIDRYEAGGVSWGEFENIFLQKYVCIHNIALTDIFEIGPACKTLGKLEVGDTVESL